MMKKTVKDLFVNLSPTKSGVAKKLKMDAEDDEDDACPNATSFNDKYREFLLELTQVMAQSTTEQIAQSIKPISTELEELRKENKQIKNELAAIKKGEVPSVEIETITKQVMEKLQGNKLPMFSLRHPPGLAHVNESDSLSTATTSIFYDDFLIGCLGRDDDRATILGRAKEVLQKCGVQEQQIRDLSVPFTFGSIANVKFVDPKLAGEVSRFVWNNPIEYPGAPSKVWFDKRKSKSERWPGRFLKELLRILKEDIQSGRGAYIQVWSQQAYLLQI